MTGAVPDALPSAAGARAGAATGHHLARYSGNGRTWKGSVQTVPLLQVRQHACPGSPSNDAGHGQPRWAFLQGANPVAASTCDTARGADAEGEDGGTVAGEGGTAGGRCEEAEAEEEACAALKRRCCC